MTINKDHPDTPTPQPDKARWSLPVKFLVALAGLGLLGGLLIQFNTLIGPVLACFILAYLLSPLVSWLTRRVGSWSAAVNVTFLLVLLILAGLFVVAGLAIQGQITGLVKLATGLSADLPEMVQGLINQPIAIGGFVFSLSDSSLAPLTDQALSYAQAAVGQAGSLASSVASGTLTSVGWIFFVMLVAYYLLHDFPKLVPTLERGVPAGQAADVRRLSADLGPIWNAYLRGQVTLSVAIAVMIGVGTTAVGVHYGPVLGILSFFAEFIPFVGPGAVALIGVLVAYFQDGNYLGLSPMAFAGLVLIIFVVMQQIQGNILYPRIMGRSLNLHPALLLVGAILMGQWLGFVGVMLAAPLLASAMLLGGYVYARMIDVDPFEDWPQPPVMVTRRGLVVPESLRALVLRRAARKGEPPAAPPLP